MDEKDDSDRKHQIYLDAHRTNVEPIEKRAAALEQARMALALVGFRSAYALNAGAALALPAFAEILSLNDGDVVLRAVAAVCPATFPRLRLDGSPAKTAAPQSKYDIYNRQFFWLRFFNRKVKCDRR